MTHQEPSQLEAAKLETLLERLAVSRSEPGHIEEGLQRIVEAARDLFDADLCVIFAINPVTRKFVGPPVWRGQPLPGTTISLRPPRKTGLARKVLESPEPVLIENLRDDRSMSTPLTRDQGIRSLAAVPLRIRESQKPLAVVYIDFREKHTWNHTDQDLLALFGQQASQLLQSIWFLRRYREISKAGQAINQKVEKVADLVHALRPHLKDVIEIEHCFLLAIRQPKDAKLRVFGSIDGRDIDNDEFAAKGPFRRTLEDRLRIRVDPDPDASKPWPRFGLDQPGSVLIASLASSEETIGLLTIQHPKAGTYDGEDEHLFQLLANQVALACSNQQLFRDLERLQKAGEVLTQQLAPEEILERVVEEIKRATKADLVVLYSYSTIDRQFVGLPATSRGDFLVPGLPEQKVVRPHDIAWLAVQHEEAAFANDSRALYARLGGDPSKREGNFEQREKIASTAAMPLQVAGECVGVLFVNYRQPQVFGFRKRQLLEGLARYAAIAIRNARAFGELAVRPLREQEVLRAIDERLVEMADRDATTLGLDAMLEEILHLTARVIDAHEASILLHVPGTRILRTRAAIGRHRERSRVQEYSLDEHVGIVVQAFNKKQSLRVSNVRDTKWRQSYSTVGGRTLSELDVPMMIGDLPIGVLNFENRRKDAFSKQDQRFLEILAGQAVLAVWLAQRLEEAARLAKERKALIDLGAVLVRQTEADHIYRLIVEQAIETTGANAGVLVLTDEQRKALKVVAEQGPVGKPEGRYLSLEKGIIGQAATERSTINVPDVREHPVYEEEMSDTRSELAVPIMDGDAARGVINIESPKTGYFGGQDVDLMQALADLTLQAMQNATRLRSAVQWSERLQGLHVLSQTVLGQYERYDSVLETVVELALRLTQSDFADLDLYDGGTRSRVYTARRSGADGVTVEQRDLDDPNDSHFKRGLMSWVASERKPFLSKGDVQADPRYVGADDIHVGADDIHSELTVPLLEGNAELVGVLNVESRGHETFDGEDLKLLELFAAQAVIAIESAESYEDARIERERFRALYLAGQELAEVPSMLQVGDAYQAVIGIALGHWECDRVEVWRADDDSRELVRAASDDPDADLDGRFSLDQGLNSHVARSQDLVVSDAKTLPTGEIPAPATHEQPGRSFAIAQVHCNRRIYGTFALSDGEVDTFDEIDLELVRGLADQLGLTLHRLEELEKRKESERRANEDLLFHQAARLSLDVTHQLKNDLGWIANRLNRTKQSLRTGDLSEAALEEVLGEVSTAVKKVVTRGEEIADAIQEGRTLERTTLSGSQLLKDALLEVRVPSGIKVVRRFGDPAGMVRVVYKGIIDALVNLMNNATEAMDGKGTLTLGVRRRNTIVELTITDDGPGISEEEGANLFDLGHSGRADAPSGIGLASASRNVAVDLGTIGFESTPGKGASFWIRLPAASSV